RGKLQSHLGVEPCHSARCVKGPTVDRDVGDAAVAPRTNWDVQKGVEVPMPFSLMPTNKSVQRRIAKVSRALIEIEVPVCLNCLVQQWQCQSGKRVNVDIYGLTTVRNDDTETNIAAKHLFWCYP